MPVEIKRDIADWQALTNLIEAHQSDTWIYRGVTSFEDHKLVPKIGRPEARKDPTTGGYLPFDPGFELKMVSEFSRLARPYLPSDSLSPLEVLAIGQHHGQAHFAFAEIVADGLAELRLQRRVIQHIVDQLEGNAQIHAVIGKRLEFLSESH